MSEAIQRGTLYIVSTPIGNLEDLSFRALHVLTEVDLIAAEDTRKTRFLLEHFSITKPLVSHYSYNERRRVPELVEKVRQGMSVAVVTDAGTPGISDPASFLIREAVTHGIPLVPIPGATAFLPALVVSGLPFDRFAFEGFLPLKKGRKTALGGIASQERTIVLYEAPHRVERTLVDLLQVLGDRRMALVREITKKFEEVVRGNVSEILAAVRARPPRGEYVIVIEGCNDRNVPPPGTSGANSHARSVE